MNNKNNDKELKNKNKIQKTKKKSINKEITEEVTCRAVVDSLMLILLIGVMLFTKVSIQNKINKYKESSEISIEKDSAVVKEELASESNNSETIKISNNISSCDLSSIEDKLNITDILQYMSNKYSNEFNEDKLEEKETIKLSSEDLNTFSKTLEYNKKFSNNYESMSLNVLAYGSQIYSIKVNSNNTALKSEVFNDLKDNFLLKDIDYEISNDVTILLNNNLNNSNIEKVVINYESNTILIYSLGEVNMLTSEEVSSMTDILKYNGFNKGTLEFIQAFTDLDILQGLGNSSIISIDEIKEFNLNNSDNKTDITFRLLESLKSTEENEEDYWKFIGDSNKNINITINKNKINLSLDSDNKLDLITIMNLLTLCFNDTLDANIEVLRDEIATCEVKEDSNTVEYRCNSRYIEEQNNYNYSISIVKRKGE